MTIEPLTVWSLYPDWADGSLETLEFLTTVAQSPLALEQRRGLRLSPRQSFEYSYILWGPHRTHFDLLVMRSAGSPVYVPLWHDVELMRADYPAGTTVLVVDTPYTEFSNVDVAFIGGADEYELVEIAALSDTSITLAEGLSSAWPQGTRVAPVKRFRVDPQPSTTRRSDMAHIARIKFVSLDPNLTDALPPLSSVINHYVLEEDPNEVDDLTYAYDRVMSVLDNKMGPQYLHDVTGQVLQQFAWYAKGRAQHHRLRGLFYSLDGRRVPLWVPTIYRDFEPVAPINAADTTIDVRRCGFTDLGGPMPQREFILIQAENGARYYRKITTSAVVGGGEKERLSIDESLGVDLTPDQIRRISFLVLCRLDQDTVEITHHTATRGLTTAVAVFRSAVEGIYDLTSPVCISHTPWYTQIDSISVYGQHSAYIKPDKLDRWGYYYYQPDSTHLQIYTTQGVLLSITSLQDIVDAVNARYGIEPPAVDPGTGLIEMYASPFRQGRYVMVHFTAEFFHFPHHAKWWVLTEPDVTGHLKVLGAVWYKEHWFNFEGFGFHLLEVNSDDTCILCEHQIGITYMDTVLSVLPPITDFLGSTAAVEVKFAAVYPIGNEALSTGLFFTQNLFESAAFGFRLPGNGREVFFIYMPRSYMDICMRTGTFCDHEVINVIGPAYPNGAMIKCPLPDLTDYETFASVLGNGVYNWYWGQGTEPYTVDNANWRLSDGDPAIPFPEEYHYLSDGTFGGTDCFSPQVGTQLRSNGHYWVTFVMAGMDDSQHRASPWASPIYAKVRVFDYDPSTEIAVEVMERACTLQTEDDVPLGGITDVNAVHATRVLIPEILESGGVATVVLHGAFFRVDFCRFAFDLE